MFMTIHVSSCHNSPFAIRLSIFLNYRTLLTMEPHHTVNPLLDFSRIVRNYIPSIPMPTASRAPRPVFAGSFMPSALLSTSPAPPIMTKRRGSSGSGVSASDCRACNAGQLDMDDVFGSDEDGGVLALAAAKNRTSSHTSYPGVADGDLMLSRWDESRDHGDSSLARRLLFLGYSMGLHIWDCSSLGDSQSVGFGLGTRRLRGSFACSVIVQG
jgi:hypothetical protein